MNYKRHNQGLRAHIRRRNFRGCRAMKLQKLEKERKVSLLSGVVSE